MSYSYILIFVSVTLHRQAHLSSRNSNLLPKNDKITPWSLIQKLHCQFSHIVTAYLPTYENQKTGHQATLGLVYSVPKMEPLKMFRVCILSSFREGLRGLNFSQFIRNNAGGTCFLNWNYIVSVVLTVEIHITETSRKLGSPVF